MRRYPFEKLELSPEHRKLLEETVIREDGPGTILRDFNAVLNLLVERSLPVTPSQLLSMSVLPEINARLAHPLKLGLKRAQQKSYPHIHGLYLLLRASGLTSIEGVGKKLLLSVDQVGYESWKGLNPTEQYCTLLEAWLIHGRPEIIGERGSLHPLSHILMEWYGIWETIPKKGVKPADDFQVQSSLQYGLGTYNFALLELFGVLKVRHGLPVEGSGWSIERIYRTEFGDALMSLLCAELFDGMGSIPESEDKGGVQFGVLQPVLQPCFPGWKSNLSVPDWVFREGAHIFKVTLGGVWLRVAIAARSTLDDLSSAILGAVKFDDDHLHQFTYRNRLGARVEVNHYYMEDGPWTDEVRVGDVPLRIGQSMTYLFDFGDKWEFEVTLEQVDKGMAVKKPRILEAHGKPPEQYPSWEE